MVDQKYPDSVGFSYECAGIKFSWNLTKLYSPMWKSKIDWAYVLLGLDINELLKENEALSENLSKCMVSIQWYMMDSYISHDNFCKSTQVKMHKLSGLQTSCYKLLHKLSTSCVRTACSQLL